MYSENKTATMEQKLDTIDAMRRQEALGYSVVDYLSGLPKINKDSDDEPVDASVRFVMAKWFDGVADFFEYKRETVAIAMNILDRFMSTPIGQEILFDREQYKLAAMTALYTTVKIHERECMAPDLVSRLSQGLHKPEAIEVMESKMLNAIQWRVNPPTAMSFLRSMIDLVPDDVMHPCEKESVADLATLQIETMVCEYRFCGYNASSIAFACVLNAIDSVIDDDIFYTYFKTTMGNATMIDNSEVKNLRVAIYELLNGNDDFDNAPMKRKSFLYSQPLEPTPSYTKPAVTKNNRVHLSPRSITSSVAQR